MSVNLPSADFVTSSLNGQLAAGATTATIGSGLDLPATNGVLQISYDTANAVGATNGPETVTYSTYTSGSGALTGLSRGQAGTTDVQHDNGQSVQSGPSVLYWNESTIGTYNGNNLAKNGNFINNSTNGYGSTADDWTSSNANPVQGGFPTLTKAELINLLGVSDGDIEGLWNLNGNFTDLSSNSYNLTAGAGGQAPTDSSDGLMAQCKDFETSSSQYASIADASCANLEISGSQTFIAFVKPESIGANRIIMNKGKASTAIYHQLLITSANAFAISLTGLTTNATISSNVLAEAAKWYMVVGVYDSTNTKLKIWVNGVKKEVTASGSTGDTNATFNIGADNSGGADALANFFDGLIQNCAVLSVALSDAQVKRLWAATSYKGQKIRRATTNAVYSQALPEDLVERLRGKQVTLRASVYQAVASTATISLDDGSASASDTSSNTGQWETHTVTKTISATATSITIKLNHSTSDGNTWFKEVALYEGSGTLPYAHSEEDWNRFPQLLKLDPPGATNGYCFEENRVYDFTASWTASGSMTYGTVTQKYAKYSFTGKKGWVSVSATGTTGGVANTYVTITNSPVIAEYSGTAASYVAGSAMVSDGGFGTSTLWTDLGDTSGLNNLYFAKSNFGNWGLGAGREVAGEIILPSE